MTEWTVIDPGKGAPQSADAGGGYTVIAPGDTRPLSFMDTMADQARQWGSHIVREVPRQAGLTLRHAAEGVAGIADPINLALQALGFHIPTAQSVAARRLTQAGVPEPATALERGVGDVSRAITQTGLTAGAAGAARAGAGLMPAPGATERVLDILRSQPATQAAAATGAGAGGALVRENELGGPWAQLIAALAGGGVGAAATAIPKTLAGIWSGAKAAVQPMSTEGQNAVVGATLNRLARDPGSAIANMEAAPSFVPGSFPTTAEAALDPGLAGVQRVVADMPIHGPNLAARASEQNAARLAALRNVSGTPAELARATAERDATAAREYPNANTVDVSVSPKDAKVLAKLMDRPAMATAWASAQRVAANRGMPPEAMNFENPQFMHHIKMGLDDAIEAAKRGGQKAEMAGIVDTKNKFLDALDNVAPFYGVARGNYAAASGPINRMEALQNVEKTSQMGPLDLTGEPILSQARMKTNLPAAMADVNLTPEQTAALEGVLADLNRSASTARAGANTTGSNTFKNLATSNALAQGFGRGAAGDPIAGILAYPLTKLYQWGGVNESLEAIIARAMQDPAFAAQLMKAAPRTKAGMTLGEVFAANARPAIAGASIGAATNQETSGAP